MKWNVYDIDSGKLLAEFTGSRKEARNKAHANGWRKFRLARQATDISNDITHAPARPQQAAKSSVASEPAPAFIPIPEVDTLSIVMGGGREVMKYLSPYKDIPKDFRRQRTKWNKVASHWFFHGIQGAQWTPKPGVDTKKALRALAAILRSFEPSHEHKEAGVAYLMSLWFDDVVYQVTKKG